MTTVTRTPDPEAVEMIVRRLQRVGSAPIVIENFLRQYRRLAEGETGLIPPTQIEPAKNVVPMANLWKQETAGRRALKKTVVVKLNGGLGTSMGLDRAKSLLPVKKGSSFLDLIVGRILYLRHAYQAEIPLLLMNSFSTDEDTQKALARYPELKKGQGNIPLTFLQHKVPKIRQDNLFPIEWSKNPDLEWCPPGHGDLYVALAVSGLLDQLIDEGFEYAFVSNSDNLGATLDLSILGRLAQAKIPFMMEVAERTEADKKGGHLARLKSGGLVLRERAQCPEEEFADFENIEAYRYFNTNNLWLNLKAIKAKLEEQKYVLCLSLIINRKTVDPRDPKSPGVYQMETAAGSAISLFPDAQAVKVPRSRFTPVKTTNDLLALWSDVFELTEENLLAVNKKRKLGAIVIDLDPAFYRNFSDFEARFPRGAPSLIDCASLTVKGDILFKETAKLKGDVCLENPAMEQKVVD